MMGAQPWLKEMKRRLTQWLRGTKYQTNRADTTVTGAPKKVVCFTKKLTSDYKRVVKKYFFV